MKEKKKHQRAIILAISGRALFHLCQSGGNTGALFGSWLGRRAEGEGGWRCSNVQACDRRGVGKLQAQPWGRGLGKGVQWRSVPVSRAAPRTMDLLSGSPLLLHLPSPLPPFTETRHFQREWERSGQRPARENGKAPQPKPPLCAAPIPTPAQKVTARLPWNPAVTLPRL